MTRVRVTGTYAQDDKSKRLVARDLELVRARAEIVVGIEVLRLRREKRCAYAQDDRGTIRVIGARRREAMRAENELSGWQFLALRLAFTQMEIFADHGHDLLPP